MIAKLNTLKNHLVVFVTLTTRTPGRPAGLQTNTVIQAIIKIAKSKFKIEKLVAITLETNKSSRKLLKKLDFNFEKKVKPFEDNKEPLLFAKTL